MNLDNNIDCAICLEKINNNNVRLRCNHIFCNGCILFVKNKRCPLCRKKYNLKIELNTAYNRLIE